MLDCEILKTRETSTSKVDTDISWTIQIGKTALEDHCIGSESEIIPYFHSLPLRHWIRIVAFSWSIWLFIGLVSAIVAVARVLPVFEPRTAVTSGAILAQPSDLDLAKLYLHLSVL